MYASFDSTAAQPTPVTGWYDALTPACQLVPAVNLLTLTQAEWDNRLNTPFVSAGVLVAPPVPAAAQLLTAAQAAQAIILQAGFQAAMALPVPFTNAAGVASSYPNMDTVSFNGKTAMQNLETVINAGAAAWTFKYWLDVNGDAQIFTFADVQGLAAAMSAQDTPSELNLVSKIGQVQKATTVSAVQKIIF